MRFQQRPSVSQQNLNMTAMIDIVFLLLVFFVMTFRVVASEGDFTVTMPAKEASSVNKPTDTPFEELHVYLNADRDGELTDISLGERSLPDFVHLQGALAEVANSHTTIPVTIHADEHLRYEWLIDAITAVEKANTAGHRAFAVRLNG